MKKTKIMKVVIIALAMVMIISNVALATNYGQLITDLNSETGDPDLNSSVQGIVGAIISVTRIIAVGVAIIMLAAVAMKYMSSAPGDRAEIKKHAVIYVVGAVVLFGSAGILGIIQNFAGNI